MTRYTYAAAVAGTVDSAAGTISGVSVITEGPALGHGVMIDATSLETVRDCAMQYAGGLKVKMNHYSGADAILGTLRNFRIEGRQLRADLTLLRNHSMRALVLEMAETMPDAFGLSISFSGSVDEVEEVKFVRCLEIYSCDIVDQPAANPSGLFSERRVDTLKVVSMSEPSPEFTAVLAERDTARAQAQTNFAAIQALTTERDSLATELSARAVEITDLNAKLVTAAQDFQAYKDAEVERINAEAVKVVAASGRVPVAVVPDTAPNATVKLMKRAEFDKLPHMQRGAFIKGGGKLED